MAIARKWQQDLHTIMPAYRAKAYQFSAAPKVNWASDTFKMNVQIHNSIIILPRSEVSSSLVMQV